MEFISRPAHGCERRVPALIYKQRLASFSVRPTLRRIATALMAAAQVKGGSSY